LTLKLPVLYPILDTAVLAARGCALETAAAALLDSGAGILQIRHKGHWSRDVFEQSRRIAALCAGAGAPLIVNDRADIAMLLGAGLHVGQEDLPPVAARRLIGPEAILGFSTHNAEQLAAAAGEPLTYVALGPMYATRTKENPDPVVGPARLREWRSLSTLPLVAIGGVTRANARAVLDAGADSLAVIGDLFPDPCDAASIAGRMREWRRTISR
jgi:thiamine-phosphate pyrophosphorylase